MFFVAVRIRPYYGSFHTQIVESAGVGFNLPAENTESVSERLGSESFTRWLTIGMDSASARDS